jgi:hypothetical protein
LWRELSRLKLQVATINQVRLEPPTKADLQSGHSLSILGAAQTSARLLEGVSTLHTILLGVLVTKQPKCTSKRNQLTKIYVLELNALTIASRFEGMTALCSLCCEQD